MTVDTKLGRELLAGTTPGKWRVDTFGVCATVLVGEGAGTASVASCGAANFDEDEGRERVRSNAKFIAWARNNAEELLAAAATLERVEALLSTKYVHPRPEHVDAVATLACFIDRVIEEREELTAAQDQLTGLLSRIEDVTGAREPIDYALACKELDRLLELRQQLHEATGDTFDNTLAQLAGRLVNERDDNRTAWADARLKLREAQADHSRAVQVIGERAQELIAAQARVGELERQRLTIGAALSDYETAQRGHDDALTAEKRRADEAERERDALKARIDAGMRAHAETSVRADTLARERDAMRKALDEAARSLETVKGWKAPFDESEIADEVELRAWAAGRAMAARAALAGKGG